MNNLIEVLRFQSKHQEAEQIHRQTLVLSKMEVGKEHSDALGTLNNMAITMGRSAFYYTMLSAKN